MCEKPKDPGKSDLQGSDEKQNNEPNQNPGVSRRRFFGVLGGAVAVPQVGSAHQTVSVTKQALSPAIKFALECARLPQAVGRRIDFLGLLDLVGLSPNSLYAHLQESFLAPDASQGDEKPAHRLRRAIESLRLAAEDGQYSKMSLREFFAGDFHDDSPALQELRKVGMTLDKMADGFGIAPDLPLEDVARNLTRMWNNQIFKLIEKSSNLGFDESMQLLWQYIPTGNEQEARIRRLHHILLQRKRETVLQEAKQFFEWTKQDNIEAQYYIACTGNNFILQPYDIHLTSLLSVDLHPLNFAFWAIRKEVWLEMRSLHSIKIQRLPLANKSGDWQYMVKINDINLYGALRAASAKGILEIPIIPHQANNDAVSRLSFNDLAPFWKKRARFEFEEFKTFFTHGAMPSSLLR